MSRMCMPLLVLNLGCEMVYILDRRLIAQKVSETNANKVRDDIAKTLFAETFVDDLFKLQDLYSKEATRKVFDQVAQCSIMKLNESSMDKLYDLMVMTFKYQVLSASNLDQLVKVTTLHLQNVREIVAKAGVGSTPRLLDRTEKLVRDKYDGMSVGQLHLIRQTLLSALQGIKVKSTLLMEEKIQTRDGFIRLPKPFKDGVGVVHVYDDAGETVRTDRLSTKYNSHWDYGDDGFFEHQAPLGANLYSLSNSDTALQGINTNRHPVASASLPISERVHPVAVSYPHHEDLNYY